MLHIYRLDSGLFTGIAFDMRPRTPEAVAAHTPEGCAAMELTAEQCGHVRVDVDTGEIVPYEAPSPSADALRAMAAQVARERRDQLIAATSWRMERALDRGEPLPKQWKDYRQALRDVPEQPGFPESIEWPEPPPA